MKDPTVTVIPLKKGKREQKDSLTGGDPQVIIRLIPRLDEAFRDTVRYRGDVSTGIVAALNSVNLEKIPLVDLKADKARLRSTTAKIPIELHERCKAVAERRQISMNELFNTAVAHWLAGKKLVKLT